MGARQMTDHGATSVVTGNLRDEAVKWREPADRMGEIQRDPLGNNGLALEPTAFFIGPTELVATAIHSAAYDEHYASILSLLIAAAAEVGPMGTGEAGRGSAGTHTGAVEKAVDQIRQNIAKIASETEKLIDRCNSKWPKLSPAAQYFVHQKIKEFKAALDRILKFAEEVLARYKPVLSLINISFHWQNAVKVPVSNLSQTVTDFKNPDLARWVARQKDAVEAAAEQAGFISEWLYGIVLANVEFVTELTTVIGEIAGEITAAAREAMTVIDIPWAIDRLAAACGLIVDKHINTLLSIAQRVTVAGEDARKVISDRVDYSRFPGGAWPQAVKG
jgi:hypothetical protein